MGLTRNEGTMWTASTLRLCMTEPAFFYVQLFSASGSLTEQGRLSHTLPLWLRGETIRALNNALDDPQRALSNAVILAVGRVALHETLYGDKDAARLVHRPAYHRMRAARGGAQAMGLPELTLRLMNMFDRFMVTVLGPMEKSDNRVILGSGRSFDLQIINDYRPGAVEG
jgi:hypothetical protein